MRPWSSCFERSWRGFRRPCTWTGGIQAGLCTLSFATLFALPAGAMPSGIATPNCNGCHEGEPYQGEVALIPGATLIPGEKGEFTLRITEQNMEVAGYFVTSSLGTWTAGPGNRTSGDGIVHSMPVAATNGVAEATFSWTPPTEPGGADFGVYVIAANDDRTPMGDRPASAIFSYVWGCDGVDLYEDIDGDGFGSETGAWSLGCEAREGWSAQVGDCNDLWASIHPGAAETADGRDEDCNGEIDDGIVITTWYIDEDQDGFGYGAGVDSDVAPVGYVGNRGDCDDEDPEISPAALEVCDGRDNDCNQQLDDGKGVSVTCGVGLCGRTLEVCDHECTPGSPTPEMCNGLDDDCDGEIDEAVTCPDGMQCVEYTCVVVGAAPAASEGNQTASTEAPPSSSAVASSEPATSAGVPETRPNSSPLEQQEAGVQPSDSSTNEAATGSTPSGQTHAASGCVLAAGRRHNRSTVLPGVGVVGVALVLFHRRRRGALDRSGSSWL